MKIRLPVILAATAVVALAGGCSSSSPAASSGSSSAAAAIPLLRVGDDAALAAIDAGQDKGNDVYGTLESLTQFGPGGQVEPALASSVTQPNPVTYVYHLRQGVQFWDGNEMTSSDVVNALDYYRQPGAYIATEVSSVKSITATGRYTVVVALKYPYAPWLSVTTSQIPVFEKKFQDEHPTTMGQPGVLIQGTGPFKIDSFDPTTGLELSANPHWWGGRVPIKHVSVKLFASETSEALAFRASEIDGAYDVLNPRAFASASGATMLSTPAFAEGYFGMNVHQAPWNDIHVRRAVAYALNPSDIIAALGNGATPVSTLIPPIQLTRLGSQAQVSTLVKSLPSYLFDLAKAKAELAQSAYPHGFTATTQTISFGAYTPATEAIAGDLGKIGINLKIKVIGFNQYEALVSGPKASVGGVYGTFNVTNSDPTAFPSFILGSNNIPAGGFNWANYDPPVIDTLINEGTTTQDPAKRLAIYGQMLKILATDMPWVPIYIEDYNFALSSKYTWPGYDVYTQWGAWELHIKPRESL
ncbi:MAG TPA: ABC transporter substrate-binding protein [Streptosporangiaceae bacterium]